ncbi:MAG: TM1266 family iron-only hydrogenase system putative regulator [Eubacteriales bacterium]
MKRIAVVSAILEDPKNTQHLFNDIIADFKGIIRGRMGLPVIEEQVSIITIVISGELNEINSLTGKLGRLDKVSVKTSISKKEFD